MDDCLGNATEFKINRRVAKSDSRTHRRFRGAVIAVLAAFACLAPSGAHALSLIGQEPDPSVIVNVGDLQWAWAGPCAGLDPSCGVVELHHNFMFASDAQWRASFASIGALQAAFMPGGAKKCAATYFALLHDNCDSDNLSRGSVWRSPLPGSRDTDALFAETFLVRVVPEPGPPALLLAGLAALSLMTRRRKH